MLLLREMDRIEEGLREENEWLRDCAELWKSKNSDKEERLEKALATNEKLKSQIKRLRAK